MKAYFVETTAAGTAAIAVLEVVGPDCEVAVAKAFDLAKLPPDALKRKTLSDGMEAIDDVLVRLRRPEDTMTGWPHLEIQCHGSRAVVKRIRKALVSVGVVPAPQTFLFRTAVSNGKMTRLEGEAWLCAMNALTERAANEIFEQWTRLPAVVDRIRETRDRELLRQLLATYPYGLALSRPHTIAILGSPNSGKSTLVNALAGRERVLVDELPGTTRDVVHVPISIAGIPFTLIDTAGIRPSTDPVEQRGVLAAKHAYRTAHQCIWLADPAMPSVRGEYGNAVLVWSKADIRPATMCPHTGLRVSAQTGEGMEELRQFVLTCFQAAKRVVDGALLFTARQAKRARELFECPDSEWQTRWERWVYGRPRTQ